MGRKPKQPIQDPYDHYTEACPKMTRRWKTDIVPELSAWLLLIRARIERSLTHQTQAAQLYGEDAAKDACSRLRTRLKFCEELISQLYDKWSEDAWWSAVKMVATAIDLKAGKPVHQPKIPGMADQCEVE